MRKFIAIVIATILTISVTSSAFAGGQGGFGIFFSDGQTSFGIMVDPQKRYQHYRQPRVLHRYVDPYWGQQRRGHYRDDRRYAPQFGSHRLHRQQRVYCDQLPRGARWRNYDEAGRIGFVNCSDGTIRYWYVP